MNQDEESVQMLSNDIFQYRVMSTHHIQELKADFETLKSSGLISDNETYRRYIEDVYELPDDMFTPTSLIVMAVYTPHARAVFQFQGANHEIVVPHQYYHSGVMRAQLETTIHQKIIGEEGHNLEMAHGHVLLKQVAVRSGLGRYGRNNICYVDGMGSFITLHAFWTDYEFDRDDWHPLRMMDECENCRLCLNRCPTKAIREDNFVIDAGRCLSLYNEIPGVFPEWIPPESHNALMGCMHCQERCPGNRKNIKDVILLGTVTEDETESVLRGEYSEELSKVLSEKLSKFPGTSEEYFPVFTRNLSVLLKK